jgi:hypothetical protein
VPPARANFLEILEASGHAQGLFYLHLTHSISQTTSTFVMSKDEVLNYTAMCLTVSVITFGRCSCVVAIVFYLSSVPENIFVVNSASN